MQQMRSNCYLDIGHDNNKIILDYRRVGWESVPLVHYAYHWAPKPRSQTIIEIRNPL